MPPPPLLPYEYGCTYHRLGFIEVRLQYHHVEHIYRHCQCILYPIMVLPQYPSIICIEDTGSLHRRLSHAMLRLLWDAYHLQYRLHHRIHHNVKNYGGCGVTLCYFYPYPKRHPQALTCLWYNPFPLPVILEQPG